MFRLPTLLVALIACLPAPGLAQAPTAPRWDFAVTAGLFEGRPVSDKPSGYGDDWYASARAGVAAGRYWTTNLKTKVELMTSSEGMRFAQRVAALPNGTSWPYGAQEHFRLTQGSARVVWQLLENRWIHPYVLAGIALDLERQRAIVAEQYHYSPGGPGSRQSLVRQQTEGPATVHRVGAIVGAGAKLYLSPRAFANTAVLVTHAKPAKTVGVILGLGLDF